MPEEKKPRHPEINFLPPLDMILSFFKKDDETVKAEKLPEPEEVKDEVKRIIEHINHDHAQNDNKKTKN